MSDRPGPAGPSLTDADAAAADGARLDDAAHVVHGEEGTGAVRRILYAVYVGVLLATSYGFTLTRALFATADPAALRRELLSPVALTVAIGLVVVVGALARTTGRTRGPVVPPLPWTDQVATAALDRALVLRQWWLSAAIGGVAGGLVLGAAVGAGAWSAGVGGPAWLLAGLLAGPAIGWAFVLLWLLGQVAAGPTTLTPAAVGRGVARPRTLLRLLGVEDLRQQGVRSSRVGGGVLAGDLRAVRLEIAAPVTRARGRRLRSAGPVPTVIRRDMLGLRRSPGAVLAGLALVALGAAGLAWALDDPAAPAAVAWPAALACYLGFGWWSEGLRLQGDNGGTAPLLGVWGRREAWAHLVVPATAFALVAEGSALAVAITTGAGPGTRTGSQTAGWMLLVLGGVAGSHLLAAFRGQPPEPAFMPGMGPGLLAAWYAYPLLLALVGAGAFTTLVAAKGASPVLLVAAVAGVGLTLMGGLARVDALESAHRQ